MAPWIVLNKSVGQTPLECLEAYRNTRPDLVDIKMAYAGRLDPMASGRLLVLLGKECKRQTNYHGLDKEYVFQILFGVSSDSGDVLGLVKATPTKTPETITKNKITVALNSLAGEITLPYPSFSSKTVAGKPLFLFALSGETDKIDIPTKTSTIYQLELLDHKTVTAKTVYNYIAEKIETIKPVTDSRKATGGDFRRDKIRPGWLAWYEKNKPDQQYHLATCLAVVSSGTYIRTLASTIADKLGTTGLAYSIDRTKIGRFKNNKWQSEFLPQ